MDIIKEKNGRREISLTAVARLLFKKVWIIIIAAVIGGAALFIWTRTMVSPTYKAAATLYISNASESAEPRNITTNDLNASMMLMYTCSTILRSEETMQGVIAASGVDYDAETLQQMVQVSEIENTNILVVSVTAGNPEEAAMLANTVADLAPGLMKRVEAGASVKVFSEAKVPDKRSSPSNSKAVLLGVVIGTFLSVMAILIMEIFDTRIKEQDVLSLGAPLLGVLQLEKGNSKKRKKDETKHKSKKGGIQKEPRSIEENVMFSLPDSRCKKIVLAGILPGDEICEASTHLAAGLSSCNFSVLLIDCDLRHQKIAEVSGLHNKPGVSNMLIGQHPIENCIQHYGADLNVITSGTPSPNPEDLLSSEKMMNLLEEVETRYEYVLLNTEPIGEKEIQESLCKYVKNIIITVHLGITRKDILRGQLEKFKAMGCRIIGLIVVSDREL